MQDPILTSGRDYLGDNLLLEQIAEGVHDAGNPYFDYLFGSSAIARTVLRQWVRRPNSEVYAGRVQLQIADGQPVGGFIAMTGDECHRCRLADGVALLHTPVVDPSEVGLRMAQTKGLFVALSATDWYVSKMWVSPACRGCGFGHVVAAAAFFPKGAAPGRTVADVHVDNSVARHVYTKQGIVEVGRHSSATGLTYVTISVERGGTVLHTPFDVTRGRSKGPTAH